MVGCMAAVVMPAVVVPTVSPVLAAGLTPATSWSRERAGHLLRRAGFGATPDEIDRVAGLGLHAAVASMVDYERVAQTDPDFQPVSGTDRGRLHRQLTRLPEDRRREVFDRLRRLDHIQIREMRAWWIRRMVNTPRPFEEKMTLFWHGHFTSGHREVRNSTMMYRKNQLLRENALGNFRDILVAVSQDPAMLRYLNNAQNKKKAPNENYARELLELFTMGEGNYSETDIKQAARALTGWTLRDGGFQIVPWMHDYGEKTFLGQTGDFDGYDVIRIILEQPQTARHLSRRILTFFVTDDPPDDLVDDFAEVIRENEYDLRESMRRLFSSEAFYDDRFVLNHIKSPVELVVGTLRLLETTPRDFDMLETALNEMGQQLFQPPNVKGWPGGHQWINTATLFTRYNFATDILVGTAGAGGRQAMFRAGRIRDRRRTQLAAELADVEGLVIPDEQITSSRQPPFDPTAIIERQHLGNVDRTLNHMIDRFLQTDVSMMQRKRLRSLLEWPGRRFRPRTDEAKVRVISLINTLMTMPEYQLN